MITIDSILPVLNQNFKTIENKISKKDKRILLSLIKQVSTGIFLTENQGNLLVKILRENSLSLKEVFPHLDEVVNQNLWSKEFRKIQKIRKIYISEENTKNFVLEFNFNARLKDKLSKLMPVLRGSVASKGTKYVILLDEHNIYTVVNAFIKDNFEINETILKFYQEIEKIKESSDHPFEIFSTKNEKLKKFVEDEVNSIALENLLLLQDRKIRYQYKINEKNEENSLVSKIAHRSSTKIYANPQEIEFLDLISSLKDLKRFPAMFIFEGHSSSKDKKCLNLIENALKKLEIDGNVGIYFRYDKEEDKENFNQEISTLGYNKNLENDTTVVGISNSKLPKFMLKSNWKPKSVVTFTNSFRANKASVYCMDVDLIVYYTNTQPLDEKIHALM